MKGINLIPKELQKKQHSKIQKKYLFFIPVLILCFGGFLATIDHMAELETELQKIMKEKLQLQSQQAEIIKTQQKINEIQNKIIDLNLFKQTTWGSKFIAIEKAIPEGVPIDLLATEEDNLIIEGKVEKLSLIASFIKGVENLNYIESVSLKNAQKVDEKDKFKFIIVCKIKQE